MSKPVSDPAPPDADALNRAIRELWARADGPLSEDEQRIYQALVLKWTAAQEGDVDAVA
ncbi:hypothetical protein [Streptomyces sp. DH12]|uniref:hypothetical protein n=1 Tax=Streptomyces sp. DH12 TaxID=2857010 RepID=UPI001E556DA5|nr:hypothetical protein [Streptomyces sp. DH12]